jgi:hypothetical protein
MQPYLQGNQTQTQGESNRLNIFSKEPWRLVVTHPLQSPLPSVHTDCDPELRRPSVFITFAHSVAQRQDVLYSTLK